jgi:rhodanese-related sulfurtransferase
MLGIIKKLFGGGPKVDFGALVSQGAVIVDVRTSAEYKGGHIKGSVNLPLDTLRNHVDEFKKKGKPVITVCRSGARSGMGKNMLKQHGIEAYNGGPWNSLQRTLNEQ